MKLTVALKPHCGLKKLLDPSTRQPLLDADGQELHEEIYHHQQLVFAGGKQVAIYCGEANEPGRFLSFIAPYPESYQQAVAAEVAKLVGGNVGKVAAPPPEEHDVPGE